MPQPLPPSLVSSSTSRLDAPVTSMRSNRGLLLPTAIIGVGLSGFFDGILLHQVLQWHHLLSLVPGKAFRDIGTQILADGMFHVLMYLIAASGLWLLWRRRAALAEGGADWRVVAAGGLLGFGAWNVIDVGFFHWILGIHRIRVNVPDPMIYDLSWLAGLGLVPLVLSWLLLRRGGPAQSRGHGVPAAVGLGLLAVAGGTLAARPQPNSNTALVLFAPGSTQTGAFNAAQAAGTPILWMDPRGKMMAVSLSDHAAARLLYDNGALLVTRSPALAGCSAALKA